MIEIEIKKNIPIPDRTSQGKAVHSPLTVVMRKMEIGDCIDLPFNSTNKAGVYSRSRKLGIGLEVRTLDNGADKTLRVWRVK